MAGPAGLRTPDPIPAVTTIDDVVAALDQSWSGLP